jgi:hypothetical protein
LTVFGAEDLGEKEKHEQMFITAQLSVKALVAKQTGSAQDVVTASAEILSQGQDGPFAIRTREEFAAIVQTSYMQPQLEILRKQEEAREQLKAEFDLGMQMLKLEYENVIRDRRDVPGWPRPPEKSTGAETKSKSSEDDEFLKRGAEKLGLEEKKLRLKLANGLRNIEAKHRMKASTMQEFVDGAYDKSAEAMYDAILGYRL